MIMVCQSAVARADIEKYRGVLEIVILSVFFFLLYNIGGQGIVVFGKSQLIHFAGTSITYRGKRSLLHDFTPL